MNQIYRLRRGREFCLTGFPDQLPKNAPHLQILDFYPVNTNLRWRSERSPADGGRRFALEHLIRATAGSSYLASFAGRAEDDDLWRRFNGAEIRKNRYSAELAGLDANIDVYLGAQRGLIIARFAECKASDDLTAFFARKCTEITGNPEFFDEVLARQNG
jgi:hypothetical protein